MNKNMIGFAQEYYTLQNVDGHDLALTTDNHFLTEDIAAESAQDACKAYNGIILVRKHMDTVTRVFQAVTTVEEVADTSAVAS
jgi:hypothetical protein